MNGGLPPELHKIIVQLFNHAELDILLTPFVPNGITNVADSHDVWSHQVLEVLRHASRNGYLIELIDAAAEARPRSDLPSLAQALHQDQDCRFDPQLRKELRGKLEQLIAIHVPYLDPLYWFAEAQNVATKVCSIQCKVSNSEDRLGSGFLIARDLVLTANHVVADIDDPSRIRVGFDYTRTRDGRDVRSGICYRVTSRDWLVASRPGSPLDKTSESYAVPRPDDLDFAVVRLDRPAGAHSVGAACAVEGVPLRDWIRLPANAITYRRDSPLLIYHYPEGESMKLSIEMQSVIGLNANGTRLRHRTNTLGGSSGAPCFDASWNLVAVHQSAQWTTTSRYNQAVPIAPIAEALQRDEVKAGAP